MTIPITHKDLALLSGSKPFSAAGWVFELKYDGFRVLVLKDAGRVRLLSRQGRDMAEAFPELVAEAAMRPGDFALDGELVVLDGEGKPQFETLCARAWTRDAMQIRLVSRVQPAVIFSFDVLHANGEDHRHFPLAVRKAALRGLLRAGKRIRIAEHVEEQGQVLYEHAKELDLEGVVAKRAASIYRAGPTNDWLKIRTPASKAREEKRRKNRNGL